MPQTATTESTPPREPVAPPAESRDFACESIGWRSVSETPAEADALNRRGLSAHRGGRFEESLSLFRQASDAAPTYLAARFNAACALAKLGRLGESRTELKSLLCADLPTYGPRLDDDEDLAPLKTDPELVALRARLEERYRQQAQGMSLVAYGGSPSRPWAQAVVFNASSRIIPVGPRLHHRGGSSESGDFPVVAAAYVPHQQRSIAVRYMGNTSEMAHINRAKVETFHAPSGRPESHGLGPQDPPFLRVGLVEGGAVLDTVDFDGEPGTHVRWLVSGSQARRAEQAPPADTIQIDQDGWRWARASAGYRIERGKLLTPDAEISLGAQHRSLSYHTLRVHESSRTAVVASSRWGDCTAADRFVIDVVDLATGEARRVLADEGQALVELGPDGALYVHLKDALRRYADPKRDDYDTLPSGLGLSSAPWRSNSMC